MIGGVIKGFGLGVIYYVGATTGGIDIVVKFLRKSLASVNFGTLMLILDTVILVAMSGSVVNLEDAFDIAEIRK